MNLALSGPILILVTLLLSPFACQLPGQLAPAPTLLAPADGQQFEPSEVIEFLWEWDTELGPGEKFRLTVSRDDESSANILSYLTSDLKWALDPSVALPGQYEWTVTVVYAPDAQKQIAHSQPSQARHFQIHDSPAPELLEPPEGQTTEPGKPIVLRWQWYRDLNTDEQFKVDFWRDDSSSAGITSTLTSETCYTLTLSPETTVGEYSWTVGVVYTPSGSAETRHSETSSVRRFRVGLLPAPELIEPVDGQKFVREAGIELNWVWDRPLEPDERFQVTVENSDHPDVGHVSQLITGTTYTLSLSQRSLPGAYKWSVAVVYAPDGQPKATISQASRLGYFEDEPMAAPALLDPLDGQGFSREPEVMLHWQWVRDLEPNERFKVIVQNNDDPSSATFWLSHVPTLTLSLADRATGGQYEWQVSVVSVREEQIEATVSQPSEARHFVDELPAAPVLQEPANGQFLDRESAITIRWKWIRALAPGEQFQLKVWSDGQSPADSIATILTDQSNWTLDLSQKTPDGRYAWAVGVVYAPNGSTEFVSSQTSETGHFADKFPAAPRLIQPIDGRRLNREPSVVLNWQWKELRQGEQFQILIWCHDQSPTDAVPYLTSAFSWTLNKAQRALACRYNWTVTVVLVSEDQAIAAMSPTSTIGSFEDELSSPPTLLGPSDGQEWSRNRKVTLEWEWTRDLTEDERFQVILWKPHDLTSESSSYLTRDQSLQIDSTEGMSGDEYNWRVGVVYAPSEVPQIQVSQFSEIRRFILVSHSMFWLVLLGLVMGGAVWLLREHVWNRMEAIYDKLNSWRQERIWMANHQTWLNRFEEFLLKGETVDPNGIYCDASNTKTEIPHDFFLRVIDAYTEQKGLAGCIDVQNPPPNLTMRLTDRLEFLATWHQMRVALENTTPFWDVDFANLAKRMLQQMCRQLPGIELTDFQHFERFIHGFALEGLSIPPLRIPSPFPVIILQRVGITQSDLDNDLYAFTAHSRDPHLDTRWAFVIVFDHESPLGSTKDHLRRLLQDSRPLRTRKYIVLDLRDVFETVRSGRTDLLIHAIQEQAGLASISPYHFTGPVHGDEFFGREAEIVAIESVITRHASMAITGAQRIGKTSLLMRVDDELRASTSVMPIFMDCEYLTRYEDFAKVLADKLSEDVEGSIQSIYEASQRLAARYGDRILVFLLDEVDRLLVEERDDKALFRIFRMLSQQRVCQFVFCGGRELHKSAHTANHPLARSCAREMILGNLEDADARALITRPLERMKIEIENNYDPAMEISTVTSCRPSLIQYVCCGLIEDMDEQRTHSLGRQAVQSVLSRKGFYQFYVDAAWGSSTPLEKLITLVMSRSGSPRPFSKADVYRALGDLDFREHDMIDHALDALTGNSFFDIEPGPDSYSFTLTQFPHIVRKVVKVRGSIKDELRHIRKGEV